MTIRQHYLRAARARVQHELSYLRYDAIYSVILGRRARTHRGYKTWKACSKRIDEVHHARLLAAIVLRREARDRMMFDPHAEKDKLAREMAWRDGFMRKAS